MDHNFSGPYSGPFKTVCQVLKDSILHFYLIFKVVQNDSKCFGECFVYLLFSGFQGHTFPTVALVKVQLDCIKCIVCLS